MDGRIFAAAIVAASALTFAPQTVRAQTYITTNRTVAGGNPLNTVFPNGFYIGTTATSPSVRVPNVQVDFTAPASAFFGFVLSNLQVNVLGGTFTDYIMVMEQSTFTATGGSFNNVRVSGTNATATFSGGTVTSSGGQIGLSVAAGSNTLNVNEGTTVNSIFALSGTGGNTNITGGTLGKLNQITPTSNQYAVNTGGNNVFSMSGGVVYGGISSSSINTALISGGTINGGVLTANNAVFALTGGTINGGLVAAQNAAQFQISGGTIDGSGRDFRFFNSASALVTGGTFTGTFAALGAGNLDFFGTDLVLSNATAGTYTNSNTYYGQAAYTGMFYRLTGTLQNGQTIDNTVFKASSQTGAIRLNVVAAGAPEPASLALFAFPSLLMAVRVARRRRLA